MHDAIAPGPSEVGFILPEQVKSGERHGASGGLSPPAGGRGGDRPDFEAYSATGEDDIYGIENDIVLGTWERKNIYFDYVPSSYDTDFGIADYIGQKEFPELHYNFVVKRKFENAFIVHLLPLFLVAALLFGASSALFFVLLIAHIPLREQFAGTSIVYMEYAYFLIIRRRSAR